jgi:hypothetical protein
VPTTEEMKKSVEMLDSFLNAEQKYADFQFCKIFTISKTVGV